MPLQIPLSQIGDPKDFMARVAAFQNAKIAHQGTVGEAAPREHDLVEQCVRRVAREDGPDYFEVLPFDIVDDRPSLRSRKDALIHQVSAQEAALMEASLPPGKRRFDGLKAGDLLRKPQAERSDAEQKFLADRDARLAREDAIQRHAAQLMSDIEDLTEATIETWQLPPFPGNA